jgi:hypothetical protein
LRARRTVVYTHSHGMPLPHALAGDAEVVRDAVGAWGVAWAFDDWLS